MLVLLLEGADLVLLDLQAGTAVRLKACFAQCISVLCAAMSTKQDEAC